MKRKWLLFLAALVLVAVGIDVAMRPRAIDLTLEYLGTNSSGARMFVITNHSMREYWCAGTRVTTKGPEPNRIPIWFSTQPAGPLRAHQAIQFQYAGPFNPASNDAFVLCQPEPGLISKARHWARGAGLRWPPALSRLRPPERGPQIVPANVSNAMTASNQQGVAKGGR